MQAVILAGGLGTRLREETEYRPKPMVEVGGKPILWHLMKIFAHHGVTDFIVPIGYLGHIIKEYFLNYEALNSDFTVQLGRRHETRLYTSHPESDWSVTVVDTGADTLTGGRVKRIEPFVDEDVFMVTYGDGLADVDIKALLEFHTAHGSLATMTTAQPLSRFGIVDIGPDGRVLQFREKPQGRDWISAGFFVFERGVFEYLQEGDATVLEQAPLQALAKDGELVAYQHSGFWQPMDTYREFRLLNDLWDAGKAPWKVWQ